MSEPTTSRGQVRLQIWGKGYRVSAASEEFQLLVPRTTADLSGIESSTAAAAWPRILEAIYETTDQDAANQRCLLIGHTEALLVTVAKSEDGQSRPSAVVVSGAVAIDWEDETLAELIARAAASTARLATEYGRILARAPARIGDQLREGMFVTTRVFSLDGELPDRTVDWRGLIQTIRDWRNVSGAATPRLMGFGANILIGTSAEAERARPLFGVDGVFDSSSGAFAPIGERLVRWVRTAPKAATSAAPAVSEPEPSPVGQAEGTAVGAILSGIGRLEALLKEGLELLKEWRRDRRG